MEPAEREFVVDSRESMHMLSGKNLNSAVRVSRNPTTAEMANGQVQTNLEATVYVEDLDFDVTALLEETPPVLFLGKLWEDDGYSL